MRQIESDVLEIQQYQDNLHAMLTWFLSPKSRGLELVDGAHCADMLSENISLCYKKMSLNNSGQKSASISIPELVEEDYIKKDAEYLRPIIELKKFAIDKVRDYLTAFLIHGSMATLDYSMGWSDLDTYLIVSRDTLFNPIKLLELRDKLLHAYSYLLKIDPLQHHGFLLCSELDMQSYPSYYMPVEVLKHSKSLFGDLNIEFNLLDSRANATRRFQKYVEFFKKTYETGVFKHHFYNGEYLLDNFHNRNNCMYQMKNFLGFIAILPSYYLEAKGTPCYKRESFRRIKPFISTENWELLEKAESIRREWKDREKHPYKGNGLPDWIPEMLGDNYFKRIYNLVEVLWRSL